MTQLTQTNTSRWRRFAAVAVAIFVTATTTVAAAALHGAPAGAAPAHGDSTTTSVNITSQVLGLPDQLQFTGQGSTQTLQVAIAPNLSPTVFHGQVILPTGFGAGYLNVTSGQVQLGTIPVADATAKHTTQGFAVPIAKAQRKNGFAILTITMIQTSLAHVCGNATYLVLQGYSFTYTGKLAAATSIANFLPPVLDHMYIFVPTTIDQTVEQAVLQVTAAVTYHYGVKPFHIDLRSYDPAKGTPNVAKIVLNRYVQILESPTAGAHLVYTPRGAGVLVLQGDATTLPLQTQLLAGPAGEISQGTSAVVTSVAPRPTLNQQTQTLSQLGIAPTFSGEGVQNLFLNLDESRFGGLVKSYSVNVTAGYSPVLNGDRGSVLASLNGIILGSAVLGSSGKMQMTFTIPGQAISRITAVQLQVSYYPLGGSCAAGFRTITFAVDPRSTVVATPLNGGQGGFRSLPAALVPTFQVGFDQNDIDRLSVAVNTLTGIQQMTPFILQPQVETLSNVAGSNSPCLVVGSSNAVSSSFASPLQGIGQTKVRLATGRQIELDPKLPLASIQVFDDTANHRTVVLAATSGSWSMFNPIFSYLGQTAAIWETLFGDTLATGPSGSIANVAIRAGGFGSTQFSVPSPVGIVTYGFLLSLVVALVLLALGAWVLRRRRR